MKVLRLIQYEGTETAIAEQLGRSLPDGIRPAPTDRVPTITICTLPLVWQAMIDACATQLVAANVAEEQVPQ